jgi:hypothetical protein
MAFNAAIFTGMGQAARAKQNRDRDQRTTILGNLSTLYSTLAADPYWSTPQQQQLLGQAQMELKTADPGDRKASSKSILKWGNLIKVGAIPDTPPQPPQEQTILSGEAATLGPGYGSTYDPNFVGPLPPPTPQQQANLLEAGHPEGGGVPPTGAPGAPGAGMFGLGQAPTRPPIEDWAANRRLSEQQYLQLDAWRGYQDAMSSAQDAMRQWAIERDITLAKVTEVAALFPGLDLRQTLAMSGVEVPTRTNIDALSSEGLAAFEVQKALEEEYRAPSSLEEELALYERSKEDFYRVLNRDPNAALTMMESAPLLTIAPEDTLWNRIGWFTTGPFAQAVDIWGTVTGKTPVSTATRQAFKDAQQTMVRALIEGERYTVAEAADLADEINIQPNFWTAATTLRTRMREIDKHLSTVIKRREAMGDRASVLAITQFRNQLGIPTHLRSLSDIEGQSPDSFTPQQRAALLARRDQEQGIEVPPESLSEAPLRARNIARNTDEDGLVRLWYGDREFAIEPHLVDIWLTNGAVFSDPVEAPTTAGDIPQTPRRSRSRRKVEAAPMPPM